MRLGFVAARDVHERRLVGAAVDWGISRGRRSPKEAIEAVSLHSDAGLFEVPVREGSRGLVRDADSANVIESLGQQDI